MRRRFGLILVIVSFAVVLLALAGCGGGGEESAEPETTETTTVATETTETTDTETTEATETETTDTTESGFATASNCEEFAKVGAQISSALSGTGGQNLDDVKEAFDKLAAAAPSEIKSDFETLADYFGKIADALGNLQPGQTPSADAVAKLQSIDATEATQASQNIQKWAQENCT